MPPIREETIQVDGVTVIKSSKRSRTVAWRFVDGNLTVRVPYRYSKKQIVDVLQLIREQSAKKQSRPKLNDAALRREADELNNLYFGGTLQLSSIRYVDMDTRRGSCTMETAEIRISSRLAGVPAWVRRAVIHHELCHLIEPNHGMAFHELEARYPLRPHASDYLALLERGTPGATGFSLLPLERQLLIGILEKDGAAPDILERLRAIV
jgi:predicted metal-dependent hydrolase